MVGHVISRSEFYTAYTPYQPEISQGELQAIFEFQTMICELTGMDVANSSMYDGPTALAEAAALAIAQGKRNKVLVSKAVHPEAREIIHTSAAGLSYEVVEIELKDGVTCTDSLQKELDDQTAAVLIQYPNFFGNVEDLSKLEPLIHDKGAMLIVSSNPLSLGVLEAPGQLGADIVVGDAQPIGIPASYGGPHCGYFAVKQKYMRKIPGRLVGQTTDFEGKRGFVLTLQAREQHIRREKASSNICSNQALNALAAAVAMSALGKNGIQEMALQNVQKAYYAKQQLANIDGLEIMFEQPFFNEFVIKLNKPIDEVNGQLLQKEIIGGYDLGRSYIEYQNHMLVAITEMKSKHDIDRFVEELEAIIHA